MEPLLLTSIGQIVIQTLRLLLPETPEDKLRAIELAIQLKLAENEVIKAQTKINEAEAANINRKWATWREMVGYAGASAIWWNYVLQPMIVMIGALSGHPVDQSILVQLNIVDLLGIICGMLGITYTPQAVSTVVTKIKGIKQQ